MVSLKNKRLKDPKKLILCEIHKIYVGRNGKKKIDMTKISSQKSAKGLLKKTHSGDKKLKYTKRIEK